MKAITVSELKASVGKIVAAALAGEPSLIFRNGKLDIEEAIGYLNEKGRRRDSRPVL